MNKHGLFDIYGPEHIPFWQTNAFYVTLSILCLILAGLLLWIFIKKYAKKRSEEPSWVIALRELNALKKNNVATQAQGKQFYGALTTSLKKYLHGRYGYDSMGKTDEELIKYLETQRFPIALTQELQTIFLGGTMIKFANGIAMQEQIEGDLGRSIVFIQKTIPS